jgi:hypothetical protein
MLPGRDNGLYFPGQTALRTESARKLPLGLVLPKQMLLTELCRSAYYDIISCTLSWPFVVVYGTLDASRLTWLDAFHLSGARNDCSPCSLDVALFREEPVNKLPLQSCRLLFAFPLALGLLPVLGLFVLTGRAAPANPVPNPPPNNHTAPLTTTISITYDEPISPATVTSRTFAVHTMQSSLVTATYGVHGNTVVVTPTHPFHQGELVYAIATTDTLGMDGAAPSIATQWQFNAGQVLPRCVSGLIDADAGLFDVGRSSVAWGDYDQMGTHVVVTVMIPGEASASDQDAAILTFASQGNDGVTATTWLTTTATMPQTRVYLPLLLCEIWLGNGRHGHSGRFDIYPR